MKFDIRNFTVLISHYHVSLIRKSHFLGTKLRALRKRNGLDARGASRRCIQMDAQSAPSVSYLSMIESGKRVPSERRAGPAGATSFSATPRWFLDENPDIEAAPSRDRGGAPRIAARARVPVFEGTAAGGDSRAAVADRHDRPAVRASPDPLAPGDVAQRLPRLERAAESVGERRFPLGVDDLMRLVQAPRPRGALVRAQAGAGARQGSRSAQRGAFVLRSAAHHLSESRSCRPIRRGSSSISPRTSRHKVLHGGDGLKSAHATGGEMGGSPEGGAAPPA